MDVCGCAFDIAPSASWQDLTRRNRRLQLVSFQSSEVRDVDKHWALGQAQ